MKFIGYVRVSTKRQGNSGLGLEAQLAALEDHVSRNNGKLVATYTEVESGTRKGHRPDLQRALGHARRSKATLIVAKLDRLARNVAFTSTLMEAGVDFVCCDNPHANKLTIHVLAVMAEHEAELISKRTREGLQAAKKRGVPLGSNRPGHWKGREEQRLRGLRKARTVAAQVAGERFVDDYADLMPVIEQLRAAGESMQIIADHLNAQGHSTRRGAKFTAMTVHRILRQCG